MKLTTFLLIAAIVQVSAASYAQKVTIEVRSASLESVFKEMRKQTGYDFFFDRNTLKNSKPVSLNIKGLELEAALKQCLEAQPFTYSIEEKTVVIKEKEKSSIIQKIVDYFVNINVRGKVLDDKGQPLVGATVAIKGKNRSVKTDQNGVFYLDNVGESDKLVISFIGYQNREVDAASDMGSLTMVVADAELEEVKINAGYYSVTDRERTGSISRVTSEAISKHPISNPLMALTGRVAGVQVTQLSGVPGAGFKVQIRGRNSINSGNEPLYIVDGAIFPSTKITAVGSSIYSGRNSETGTSPLNMINPNDIQSIEILKDADATAIYGSRGSNGVVVITTKKGSAGSNKINTEISRSYSSVGHKMDLLNTEEYLEMRLEALKNDGLTVGATDYDLNGTVDKNRYTDWQEVLIGGIAPMTNASLTASGGSDKSNYLISGVLFF